MVIVFSGDHPDAFMFDAFCIRARKEYTPVPPSGTNDALVPVWFTFQLAHTLEPGRLTCTSYSNPTGATADAHLTVKVSVTWPVVADTVIGTLTEPCIEGVREEL